MKIAGSTALVTGANRGLGARIVNELLAADVTKVYATARTLGSVAGSSVTADPRVEPLALDITDLASVRAVAAAADDVTVLVVAQRIIAALGAGHSTVFPDEASAAAGAVYLTDPLRLEQMLAG